MFILIVIFILIIVIINIVTRHISTPQSKVGPTNVPDHLLSSSHQTLCKVHLPVVGKIVAWCILRSPLRARTTRALSEPVANT